jgi:hypothetical protein
MIFKCFVTGSLMALIDANGLRLASTWLLCVKHSVVYESVQGNNRVTNYGQKGEISGSRSGEYEDGCLLGCRSM